MLRIDSNLIWIIVNLLIFYFLIRKFLFKPVLNNIEKRKQMVVEQFEKADTANAEAQELKTQYEASLQGAKEEAIQIVADARERADVQYKQIVSDAEKRSADLLEKTNQDMEKERDRALQSVQKEIGTLAMAAAVKIIGENSSKVTDEQLYNEFLSKTGDKHDSNNG